MSIIAGSSAASLFAAASVMSAIGSFSSIQAQRRALARENYRLETEAEMAKLQALEEENTRKEEQKIALANNLAYQSIAGYYDDGMSFLNINKQVQKKAEKDIANIRLMGKNIQHKYSASLYENRLKEKNLVFGGYTSVIAELTTGYANHKWYS
tara:strand:- start:1081 stop:1542 length:462 start_codon:yes stop_codon:yes gene_type:complete